MRTVFPLLILFCVTACGLAEDGQDEKNKTIYLTISDPAFRDYCLSEFDTNRDGRLSRYEAQRVRRIDCSDRGIVSLWEINEFTRLESFDCSGNSVASLDLRRSSNLARIVCHSNGLSSLDIRELRALTELDCSVNRLETLEVGSNSSLRRLDCHSNRLQSLDVSLCSSVMERVDARGNASMTRFFKTRTQTIRDLKIDPQTVVEER